MGKKDNAGVAIRSNKSYLSSDFNYHLWVTMIDQAQKSASLISTLISICVAIGVVAITWYKVGQLETYTQEKNKLYWEKFEIKTNAQNKRDLLQQRIEYLETDHVSKEWMESKFEHMKELIENQ
jgi:hypothetical protein